MPLLGDALEKVEEERNWIFRDGPTLLFVETIAHSVYVSVVIWLS